MKHHEKGKMRTATLLMVLSFMSLLMAFLPSLTATTSHSTFTIETTHATTSSVTVNSENATNIIKFSQNILLSTNDDSYPHHVEPTLEISDNGTLFVGYKNSYTPDGGGYRVSFVRSIDGGSTWTKPFDMPQFNDLQTRQSDPWLVWHDGTIYYAYLEFTTTSSFSQITVAKSTDLGNTWTTTAASHGSGFADKETMAISSNGTIYVAYDDVIFNGDIVTRVDTKITKSVDGGNSFTELSVIPDVQDPGYVGPYLTLDSQDRIFVAWTWHRYDPWGDVFFDSSTNGGKSFGTDIDINPESENATYTVNPSTYRPMKITLPVIRFDQEQRLYVMWAEVSEPNGSWDVYLKYSDDFGKNWSRKFLVNPTVEGNQWMPDFDVDSRGRLHVAWYEEKDDLYRPYYRQIWFEGSNRDQIKMTDVIPIAEAYTSSVFTRPGDYFTIRVDGNDVPHVVWTDGRYNEMDIFYAHGISDAGNNGTTITTTPTTTTTTTTLSANTPLESIGLIAALSIIAINGWRKSKRLANSTKKKE